MQLVLRLKEMVSWALVEVSASLNAYFFVNSYSISLFKCIWFAFGWSNIHRSQLCPFFTLWMPRHTVSLLCQEAYITFFWQGFQFVLSFIWTLLNQWCPISSPHKLLLLRSVQSFPNWKRCLFRILYYNFEFDDSIFSGPAFLVYLFPFGVIFP